MEKKLTLVVHGIGEQRPGDTLDDLVGSLVLNKPYSVDSTVRFLHDDHDNDAEAKTRNFKRFPCNIRRVYNDSYSNSFAEVYWADLSRGGTNRITALFDLFRTTLGLGYIAIANAEEKYASGEENTNKLLLTLTHTVVGAIHGPAAVISVLVGLVALVFYGISKLFGFFGISSFLPLHSDEIIAIVLTGFLGILVSKLLWERIKGYLFRTFLKWLRWFGWGNVGFGLFALFLPNAVVEIGKKINPKCDASEFCTVTAYADLNTIILGFTWVIILFATCTIMVLQGYFAYKNKQTGEGVSIESPLDSRCLLSEICILMSVLWMVLASTAWLVYAKFLKSLPGWDLDIDPFLEKSLSLSVVSWIIVICVAVASYYVVANRVKWSKAFPLTADEREKYPAIKRLVLNTVIGRTLQFSGLALAFIISIVCLVILAQMSGLVDPNGELAKMMKSILEYTNHGVLITGIFASGAAAAFFAGWHIIGMGIGIIKDIIGYFAYQKNDDGSKTYFLRDEINHRFSTVLRTLIETENVKYVTVVSHSQGTILALECLGSSDCFFGVPKKKTPKVSLVTMGSPSQYIYDQYFQNAFDLEQKRLGTAKAVTSWTNIYRADDFVGLDIEPKKDEEKAKLTNIEVPPEGHTGYWSDPFVRDVLVKDLFREFK